VILPSGWSQESGDEAQIPETEPMADSAGDSDSDGLPDAWELSYFGDLSQGPDDQGDGDGFTNIHEYELGTDPTDPTDAPSLGHHYEYDALGRLKRVIVIESRD
jgi:hypothetical protein